MAVATRRGWLTATLAASLLLASQPAPAQQPVVPAAAPIVLTVKDGAPQPRTLSLAELQALPPVTVQVTWAGAKGPQTSTFTGALLWSLLNRAAPADESGPRTRLQRAVLARGRDGYAVLLSVGELSPEFEGKQVIVAYAEDGAPSPTLRLIVPADKRAGRAVRDLVAIELR